MLPKAVPVPTNGMLEYYYHENLVDSFVLGSLLLPPWKSVNYAVFQ